MAELSSAAEQRGTSVGQRILARTVSADLEFKRVFSVLISWAEQRPTTSESPSASVAGVDRSRTLSTADCALSPRPARAKSLGTRGRGSSSRANSLLRRLSRDLTPSPKCKSPVARSGSASPRARASLAAEDVGQRPPRIQKRRKHPSKERPKTEPEDIMPPAAGSCMAVNARDAAAINGAAGIVSSSWTHLAALVTSAEQLNDSRRPVTVKEVLRDRRFHRKPMQDAFAALSTDLHRSAAVQAEITAFREGNHPMQRQRRYLTAPANAVFLLVGAGAWMAVSLDSLLSSEACNGFYKLGAVHHAGEPVGYVRIGDDMLVAAGIFEFPMHVSWTDSESTWKAHTYYKVRTQHQGTTPPTTTRMRLHLIVESQWQSQRFCYAHNSEWPPSLWETETYGSKAVQFDLDTSAIRPPKTDWEVERNGRGILPPPQLKWC